MTTRRRWSRTPPHWQREMLNLLEEQCELLRQLVAVDQPSLGSELAKTNDLLTKVGVLMQDEARRRQP